VELNTSGIVHIATPTEMSDELQGGMVMRLKTMLQAILLLGLIVAPCLAIAAEPTFKEGWFTTNDGVKLHYLEAGSGNPLVMIPGWSQSAMEFKYQLTGLSDKYHVYALDMRGHGESAKPNHGYRIQRLSADVSLPRTI
jgi:non-heme chloroperoxidase